MWNQYKSFWDAVRCADCFKIHSKCHCDLSKRVAAEMLDHDYKNGEWKHQKTQLTVSQWYSYIHSSKPLNIKYLLKDYYGTDTDGLHKRE